MTVSRFQVVNYLPSSARQVTNQRETEGIGMAFWNRNKPVKCTPQGYVGHMRHISFLAGTPPDDNVIVHCGALIERILLDMKAKKASSMTFNEYVHIIHQSEYLQLSLLVNTIIPKVVAAYPYVDSGFRWDIEVKEIYQWPEGYQGLICGVCRGVRVCLFDCFFFKNAGRYCSGVTTSFALIAIAYSIVSFEHDNKILSNDFCGFMPASVNEGGGMDEIHFASHVMDVRQFSYEGIEMVAYDIPIARPDEKEPLAITVYSYAAVEERRFAIGDRIKGYAWLFGWAKMS